MEFKVLLNTFPPQPWKKRTNKADKGFLRSRRSVWTADWFHYIDQSFFTLCLPWYEQTERVLEKGVRNEGRDRPVSRRKKTGKSSRLHGHPVTEDMVIKLMGEIGIQRAKYMTWKSTTQRRVLPIWMPNLKPASKSPAPSLVIVMPKFSGSRSWENCSDWQSVCFISTRIWIRSPELSLGRRVVMRICKLSWEGEDRRSREFAGKPVYFTWQVAVQWETISSQGEMRGI